MQNTFQNWLGLFLITVLAGAMLIAYSAPALPGAVKGQLWVALMALAALSLAIFLVNRSVYTWLVRHQQLKQSAGKLREAILIINHRGVVEEVNESFEDIAGLKAGDLHNKPLQSIMVGHPPLQHLVQPLLKVLITGQKRTNNQIICCTAGNSALLSVDYHPLYFGEKITGALLLAHPLEIMRDKHYLFETIEAERKKISIEIHDWIGRNMSSIIHNLDYLLRVHQGSIGGELLAGLEELRTKCQSAAVDMRSIMNNIHPYLLDSVGLISALESYNLSFEQTHRIKVYMFFHRRDINLEKNTAIVIYRIIQEAMSNVAKHSDASEIDIYFKEDEKTLKVEVVDNGSGREGDFEAGKGLWGMKERAVLIGGELVYRRSSGGFYVALSIPLGAEENLNA